MEIIRLSNSYIAYMQYNKDEKELHITLSGTARQIKYKGVPEGVWRDLRAAKRKGDFVVNHIVHNRKYVSEEMGVVPPKIYNKNKTRYYSFLAR